MPYILKWVEKSSNLKYGPKRLEFRLSSVLYKLASEDSITLVKLLPILTRLDRLSPDKLLRWFSSIWKKKVFLSKWILRNKFQYHWVPPELFSSFLLQFWNVPTSPTFTKVNFCISCTKYMLHFAQNTMLFFPLNAEMYP